MPKDRAIKQREADERQIAYDLVSVKDKIARLDQLFGKGAGARKQRAKLEKLLTEKSGKAKG